MIERHALERGERVALRFGDETLTYRQLAQRGRQVARGLQAAGIEPGDRVAYLGKNNAAYFEYLIGASAARSVMTPINWRLAEPEVSYIVGHARPKWLLVEERFEAMVRRVAPNVPIKVLSTGSHGYAAWRDSYSDQ